MSPAFSHPFPIPPHELPQQQSEGRKKSICFSLPLEEPAHSLTKRSDTSILAAVVIEVALCLKFCIGSVGASINPANPECQMLARQVFSPEVYIMLRSIILSRKKRAELRLTCSHTTPLKTKRRGKKKEDPQTSVGSDARKFDPDVSLEFSFSFSFFFFCSLRLHRLSALSIPEKQNNRKPSTRLKENLFHHSLIDCFRDYTSSANTLWASEEDATEMFRGER